jgi:hypothetical protein
MRLKKMISYPRAEIATVKIGHLEFEGLMLHDGTFGIAVSQICSVFSFLNKNAQRDIQSLLNEPSPFLKWSSKLNSKAVNVLLLPSFERLIFRLALKQNKVAISLSEQLIGLSLQQLFSDAFCIQFEKEERQQWLKDRQEGKEKRRTLTDSIKDYLLSHPHADKKLYPIVTDLIYLGIFNRRAADLKSDWNETNPRDEMTRKELSYVSEVEALTSRLIDRDGLPPLTAAKEALTRLIIPVCDR